MKITSIAAASLIQSCLLLKNIYIAVGIGKNNDFGSTTQYNMN